MRSPLFLVLALILVLGLMAACGGASEPTAEPEIATEAPQPTATTAPTPTEVAMEEATEAPAAMSALETYAVENAGGPGAIYVGDITQLVGPAKTVEQGDFDGNVTLESLERHLWIYESTLYQELLEKAKLTDPTPMTYDGETITIQHACINRALLPCVALETFFRPNLLERTNGKVEFITSSFPELGLAGPDTLTLVTSGTLDSATIYGGYVGGEMPPIEIQNLWGIYSSREQEFEATQAIIKDIEELFFFCREKIDTLDGFSGKKTRSHSAALSDWINGMGASPSSLPLPRSTPAIERGILDCGVTGADAGFGQRWYEVTDYIIGPLLSFPSNNNVINGEKWASIPPDLQQIIIEEAAKSELEALRISAIQNEMGLLKNTSDDPRGAGRDAMEFVPFSDEMTFRSLNTAVMEHVVPAWVNRVADTNHPIIADSFNQKVGPIVGLRIESNGTVVKIN
ncbi:Solute-binding protein Dde_0634 [Geodia barretti]|uniref:Solute-binding protein Dde_0634 n=1 Tax=Geodia barretti TaxID=519541 RepID=A0AA35QY17_GEOBA|nr:Solute-binding protein Dde_0634 [Geodia barretti]